MERGEWAFLSLFAFLKFRRDPAKDIHRPSGLRSVEIYGRWTARTDAKSTYMNPIYDRPRERQGRRWLPPWGLCRVTQTVCEIFSNLAVPSSGPWFPVIVLKPDAPVLHRGRTRSQ